MGCTATACNSAGLAYMHYLAFCRLDVQQRYLFTVKIGQNASLPGSKKNWDVSSSASRPERDTSRNEWYFITPSRNGDSPLLGATYLNRVSVIRFVPQRYYLKNLSQIRSMYCTAAGGSRYKYTALRFCLYPSPHTTSEAYLLPLLLSRAACRRVRARQNDWFIRQQPLL